MDTLKYFTRSIRLRGHLPSSLPGSAANAAGQRARQGFSLVEVLIAIGIVAVAFVAILGLIPVGLNSYRQTKNVGVSLEIVHQIVAQTQAMAYTHLLPSGTTFASLSPTPQYYNLIASGGTDFRYFTDEGMQTDLSDPSAVYEVNVRVATATPFVGTGSSSYTNLTSNDDLYSVVIQVAYNPSHSVLDIDSTNVWTGTSGGKIRMQVFTYQTYVARQSGLY